MQNFFTIALCVVIAFISFYYAKKRGRNPYSWFFIGLLFGIFGLAFLFILPVVKPGEKPKPAPEESFPEPPAAPFVKSLEVISPSHESKLWFYLDTANQQFGPMSFDAVNHAWDEGKINAQTYVWNEDLESWKKSEEVFKLVMPQ